MKERVKLKAQQRNRRRRRSWQRPGSSGKNESCRILGRPNGNGTARRGTTACLSAQDLQFPTKPRTIRSRNRPAKQVGGQRWLNQHSMNRGSTRQSVPCAVSASPECLKNRGELHRLRTGSPAHQPRSSGSASTSSGFYFSPGHLFLRCLPPNFNA
jgi:hypothetical protein